MGDVSLVAPTSDDGLVGEGSPPLKKEFKPAAPGWVRALNLISKSSIVSAPSFVDVEPRA